MIPPTGVQIHSISCNFQQKTYKIVPIWDLALPPRENPGSATVYTYFDSIGIIIMIKIKYCGILTPKVK